MNLAIRMLKKKAFTLLEIIIVVVIAGVVAGLALPRFGVTVERMRSSEGTQILTTLWAAQKRFAMDNSGAYQDGSGLSNEFVNGDLDVNLSPSGNFTIFIFNDSNQLVVISRNSGPYSGQYTVRIEENGNMHCAETVIGLCAKLGLSP